MLEMLTTFDEKIYAEGLREEGREEIIIGAFKNGKSPDEIAAFNGLPLAEVQQIIDSHKSS